MKLNFHLYSAHANCRHCMHLYHKMDQSASDPGHCSIIGSDVEDDYYCSFYRMAPIVKSKIKNIPQSGPSATSINPCGEIILDPEKEKEDKRKPKKL